MALIVIRTFGLSFKVRPCYVLAHVWVPAVEHLCPSELEELRNVIGGENADKLVAASMSIVTEEHEAAVRDSFSTMMRQDKQFVEQELKKLVQKVKDLGK